MPRTLFVSQYSTRPAGNQRKNIVIITGMNFMTFAWVGSAGAGLRSDCTNIDAPIKSGSTKYWSIAERSLIHNMKGACLNSTLSMSTQ